MFKNIRACLKTRCSYINNSKNNMLVGCALTNKQTFYLLRSLFVCNVTLMSRLDRPKQLSMAAYIQAYYY